MKTNYNSPDYKDHKDVIKLFNNNSINLKCHSTNINNK